MGNVYYNPEDHGLTIVAEVGDGGGYDWHIYVVWKDSSGAFYMGEDSGCSCYGPFEDITSLAELDRLDLAALEAEMVERSKGWSYASVSEIQDFLREVRDAVKAG